MILCSITRYIRQREGGSIGLDLTGVVADIYMGHWDSILISKLEEHNIGVKMYKRYKDDIDLILENNNDDNVQEERKEFEGAIISYIKCLADSIHESIKVTGDIPSNYEDNRLPILDLKVWIGEITTGTYKVITSHYMKTVSSRAVINKDSSHSENMKLNVMVNESMRILKNCSQYLEWDEVASHLTYFVRRLQFSGYSQKFRYDVISKAFKKYDDLERRKSLARENTDPNEETTTERNKIKTNKKKRWYAKDNKYESVMFVQSTKGSVMKNEIQKCADRNKVKIKVVEKVECSVRNELQRSDPFKKKDCGRTDCIMCKLASGYDCRTRGCVYQLECIECQRKYRGQTGNSGYERVNQHFDDWRRQLEISPLFRHSQLYHNGQEFEVGVKILKQCYGDATKRQIAEAVLIDELTEEETMNSKNEWNYINLKKINIM